jgi:hypothetical protein
LSSFSLHFLFVKISLLVKEIYRQFSQ